LAFSLDDFENPPTKGNYGQLRTIANVVPIVATGIICWQVHDQQGNIVFIWVPGYNIPSSKSMFIFATKLCTIPSMAETRRILLWWQWQAFWNEVSIWEKGQGIRDTNGVLDGLPYIQTLPIDTLPVLHCAACVKLECILCQQAFSLNVLSEQNKNLSSAQKALLLDHQRLGHIHIDHLYTSYCCGSVPLSFDELNCKPSCLVPKHTQPQMYSIPMCLSCCIAKACKLPCHTGQVL